MRLLKNILVVWIAGVLAAVASALIVRKIVPNYGDESSDEFSIVTAMSERVLRSRAEQLRSGRVLALFGGVELDLVGAVVAEDATIVLQAVFGGIDVIVPSHWRVEVISGVVFGRIGNRTDQDAQDDDAPLLLIDATAVFGGIEIHAEEVT